MEFVAAPATSDGYLGIGQSSAVALLSNQIDDIHRAASSVPDRRYSKPGRNGDYYEELLQFSRLLLKHYSGFRQNQYARQQAAILHQLFIDSFGGGTR